MTPPSTLRLGERCWPVTEAAGYGLGAHVGEPGAAHRARSSPPRALHADGVKPDSVTKVGIAAAASPVAWACASIPDSSTAAMIATPAPTIRAPGPDPSIEWFMSRPPSLHACTRDKEAHDTAAPILRDGPGGRSARSRRLVGHDGWLLTWLTLVVGCIVNRSTGTREEGRHALLQSEHVEQTSNPNVRQASAQTCSDHSPLCIDAGRVRAIICRPPTPAADQLGATSRGRRRSPVPRPVLRQARGRLPNFRTTSSRANLHRCEWSFARSSANLDTFPPCHPKVRVTST